MSSASRQLATPDEFEAYIALPENAGRLFEHVVERIVEVARSPIATQITARIVAPLSAYMRENRIAHLTTDSAGYLVATDRYLPNVAVLRLDRQAELVRGGYNPIAPDLAVEIDSLVDRQVLRIKLANYLVAGTTLWLVVPTAKQVEVYTPGKPAALLGIDGTLNPGAILPSFTLKVSAIFEGLEAE